mgnify:CR=1 FL=1|tara:strand:- start:627 stop:1727 length:1101 start_codon:yes stop_codon:yes gene_type:complete
MLDFFKKEKPFQGLTGFGGGATGLFNSSASAATQLTVPTGVSGPGVWDLASQGALTINIGNTYDVASAGGDISVTIHMWGAGGSGGRGADGGSPYPGSTIAGGGGGYTTGTMTLTDGTTYKTVVGNARGSNPEATPWGDPAPSGNPNSPPYNNPSPTLAYKMSSGGYTGVFVTSVSAPNARLMAGGGGSAGYNDEGAQGAGGGGGGTNGVDAGGPVFPGPAPDGTPNGHGATPTAGGPGGTSPHTNGSAGSSLTGGAGGARGTSGAAGGGGGAGWFGGGGGAGQTGINQHGGGGGGGSSYIHPSITSSSTTAGTNAGFAGNDSSPYYVSGRARGGEFTGTAPTAAHPGWPPSMWGTPGTITFVLAA